MTHSWTEVKKLIQELTQEGLRLVLEGDRLLYTPRHLLESRPEILERIRGHRSQLIQLIRARDGDKTSLQSDRKARPDHLSGNLAVRARPQRDGCDGDETSRAQSAAALPEDGWEDV